MKIRKIHMEDYKRFHDLTIDLGEKPKRIVAFVGPNGCGKSSVFDAMLYLDNAYGSNRNCKDYKYHSLKQDSNYNYQKISIEFDDGKNFDSVRRLCESEGKKYTVFSFRSSYRYNSNLKINSIQAVPDIILNQDGAGTSSDLDNRMEQNYRRIYARLYTLLEKDEKKYTLELAKNEIIGDLNKSLCNCLNLKIASLGIITNGNGSIYFSKNDSDVTFEYNVLSAGEKEVVDILLDLYLRKDNYTDSIYVIDEPELHINSSIQRKLINEINSIVPDNCQIWIATHSIGFIRSLQEELNNESQIIEFEEDNNWASEKYILKPLKKSRSNWKRLFSVAMEDLSNLIVPKRFIYCEGKDLPNSKGEACGLDENVYNNIFEENYPETLFVSSGGSTELEQRSSVALSVLSKALKYIEIWILKDRDMSSGKETSENQRQIYLNNTDNNHRVLKRYEMENYLFDKEVLKKYCNENKLNFDEEKYDRCIKDIVNENVKDNTGMIKSICGITASISNEIFKLNLSKLITEDMNVYKELEDCIFKRK